MPITIDDTELTDEEYALLNEAEIDAAWRLTAHKWNLDFQRFYTSPDIDSNTGLDFDVVAVGDVILRFSGTDVAESYETDNNTWTLLTNYTEATDAISGIAPSAVARSGVVYVFVVTLTGISMNSSADYGDTWGDWEEILTVSDVAHVSASSPDRVHFVISDTTRNIFQLACGEFNGSTYDEIDSNIYWPFPINSFVAVEFNDEDIIIAATQTPGNTTARYINNKVVKYIYTSGGVVAFKYRFQSWSDHIEVDIIDDVRSFRIIQRVKASVINGKIFVTAYSVTGIAAFPQTFYRYYTSLDGIWWSDGFGLYIPPEDMGSYGVKLLQIGELAYAFERQKAYRCDSTLQVGYSAEAVQSDITDRIDDYQMDFDQVTQASFIVDNYDDFLSDNPFFNNDNVIALVHEIGYRDPNNGYIPVLQQVAITEVDSIDNEIGLPENTVRVTARDHMAWMADRSQSEQAHYWESQLVGGDNYSDDTDTNYGGLRHTATQSGMWQTSGNVLTIQANNAEAVAFGTFSIYIWNGNQQIKFHLATSGNKEFAGVAFRAVDKDNMWFARYEQTADRIRLFQRLNGTDTQKAQTGTLSWSSTPLTERWIRVDFYYAHILVYYSTDGITWTEGIDFLSDGVSASGYAPDLTPITTLALEKGSVGLVGKGFAPASANSWSVDPGFIDLPTYIDTPPSNFTPDGITSPIKLFALGYAAGEAGRATGIDGGVANWTAIGTGLSGNGTWACADPYNFARRYALTTDGLYKCDDIWAASPTWSLVADNEDMFTSGADNGGHYVTMSHNRQGWILVLRQYHEVAVSFDYGASWSRSMLNGLAFSNTTGLDLYANDNAGHVEIVGHNTFASGHIYAVYTPDAVKQRISKSTDWGLTWTFVRELAGSYFRVGLIAIPYKREGGLLNNADDGSLLAYSTVHATGGSHDSSLVKTNDGWVSTEETQQNFASGTSHIRGAYDRRTITTYTPDGSIAYIVRQQEGGSDAATVQVTEDGFDTLTTVPGTDFANSGFVGLNGFPLNKNFCLIYCSGDSARGDSGYVKFTNDRGNTAWIDVSPSAIFTNSATVYCEADLTDFIG